MGEVQIPVINNIDDNEHVIQAVLGILARLQGFSTAHQLDVLELVGRTIQIREEIKSDKERKQRLRKMFIKPDITFGEQE